MKPNKSKSEQEFYLVKELADTLRISEMTVYRYIKSGKIKAHKIGKEFRIIKKEFQNFLDKVATK